MARDSAGNFVLNTLRPGKDGKLPTVDKPKSREDATKRNQPAEDNSGGQSMTLHDNGDGSYRSEASDGTSMDHPTLGHMLMHVANHHAPDSKHMHIEHDGMAPKSHQVGEDGEPEGPHDHANMEALKQHMDQFLSEEENEPGYDDESEEKTPSQMGFGG